MPSFNTNHIFANAFNLIPIIGPARLGRIIKSFPNLESAWMASENKLLDVGLEPKIVRTIVEYRVNINPEKEFEKLNKHNIQILLQTDQEYPSLLKELIPTPPLLYIRGNAKALDNLNLGIVGTRKISAYGEQVLSVLVPDLVGRGINVVSGLAFGVDASALRLALEAGACPIAVLPSSLEDRSLSPRANYKLAHDIIGRGCLVSEYPLGSMVGKQNFPVRNRLISGLSVGTLIIEAPEQSGALITANYALEQNRHVFAVPGSIFSEVSSGTNNLIKKGARLVSTASDIIEELNLDLQPMPKTDNFKSELSGVEQSIIENLSRTGTLLDDLIKETKIPASEVNATLTMLELKGRVKNLGNGKYARLR